MYEFLSPSFKFLVWTLRKVSTKEWQKKRKDLHVKELQISQNYGNNISSCIIKRISKPMAREFEGWSN